MKKLLLVVLLVVIATPAAAQPQWEFSPFLGYVTGGKVSGVEGSLEIQDSEDWGLMLGIKMIEKLQLEITYARQDTGTEYVPRDGSPSEDSFDLAINYFHIGVNYAINQEKLTPFVSFGLGSIHWDPKGVDASSRWQFSVVFGGGAKYYFTENLGLRANLRIYSTFIEAQGPLYCQPGFGCTSQIDSGTLMQVEFGLGLVLGF